MDTGNANICTSAMYRLRKPQKLYGDILEQNLQRANAKPRQVGESMGPRVPRSEKAGCVVDPGITRPDVLAKKSQKYRRWSQSHRSHPTTMAS